MSRNEFDLIKQYFAKQAIHQPQVHLGIGDDAAIVTIPENHECVISVDTLVENVHFLPDMPAYSIAYRALAVNLSDLSAMGAKPAWVTLALTLPEINDAWLSEFSNGLASLLRLYQVQLIGGDTTQGPLSITIQAHGFVPTGQALLRSGASVGDKIYVSGPLGDAAFALDIIKHKVSIKEPEASQVQQALLHPKPQVELGMALRGIASAAIDISDGLLADLEHILEASRVGAVIYANKLPMTDNLQRYANQPIQYALSGGDDYQLCFTVAEQHQATMLELKNTFPMITEIGEITSGNALKLYDNHCDEMQITYKGYQHFHGKTD